MVDKLWFLIPEMTLFLGVVVVAVLGLSPNRSLRDIVPFVTCLFLGLAFCVTPYLYTETRVAEAGLLMPQLGQYVKMIVCGIGIMLTMLNVGLIDRKYEAAVEAGKVAFDPIRANRGEFHTFFLLSLIGVMLCCNANDLIWLFLALELTSLPTYVMVAMSRGSRKAQEAAVKYFFLGALAAAMFLYGFALLYGATGTIVLTEMRDVLVAQRIENGGELSMLATIGMILAVLGVSFKIAAAPLHFYAADVYQGAASPVTAFLAFVPKAAGFIALMLLLGTLGWSIEGTMIDTLPRPILSTLWMIAVLTMTLGNIGALLQRSVKRMLAYSSIAHSGYMLIGLIAGPEHNGLNAMLFYLFAYGIMNSAAFAVLASLERQGNEIESLDDLAGMRHRYPGMAAVMAISAASLLGFPPLLGFVGKLYLFIAGINAGQILLVVIAGLNSAISAWYYLAIVKYSIMDEPNAQSETVVPRREIWPRIAAVMMTAAIVIVPFFGNSIIRATEQTSVLTDANPVIDDDAMPQVARHDDETSATP
ncbi:MAG: NADH-quinone oxidoreductase subunit N [Planctomycetota bacterium]